MPQPFSGLPVIADDSGIEVDALKGQPGIYSARFAGEAASDADNNQKLLEQLQGLPSAQRNGTLSLRTGLHAPRPRSRFP